MGNGCFSANGSRTLQIEKKGRNGNPNISLKNITRTSIRTPNHNIENDLGTVVSSQYEFGCELGRGEYGVIYLCTNQETGEKFACKMVPREKLNNDTLIENMRREVVTMRLLPSHPNIISLKTTFRNENFLFLVMDLCEGGDLLSRITQKGHYKEKYAVGIAKYILEAIQACHESGVMHRDIRPQNFLFANRTKNAPLKLINFGLCTHFIPGQKFNTGIGSPLYAAPEVYYRNYGPEADLWSAGVIIYQLLCGKIPFSRGSKREMIIAITNSDLLFQSKAWSKVSESAKDLVRGLLNCDPATRLNAKQAFEHSWFKKYKKMREEEFEEEFE